MDQRLLQECQSFLTHIPENLNYILPNDLMALMRQDPESIFILDNRTPESFREGHIPGAVNIWIKDVLEPDNLAKLPRDKRIVVCCWVGHTSSQLLTILQLLGYDAIGLKYGMGVPACKDELQAGWLDLELPLDDDATVGPVRPAQAHHGAST
jgi:rhodanese-related sulfurtransferase